MEMRVFFWIWVYEVSNFEQKQDEIDEERKKRKRTVEEKKVIDDLEKDFAIKGDDKEWAESSKQKLLKISIFYNWFCQKFS